MQKGWPLVTLFCTREGNYCTSSIRLLIWFVTLNNLTMSTNLSYDLHLESDKFLDDYDAFRKATTKPFSYKGKDYTAVYMSSDQYTHCK